MDKKPLILVGCGEFGHIAYEYFTYDSDYQVVGFAVERAYLKEEIFLGLPVIALEDIEQKFPPGSVDVHVAVTYTKLNSARQRLYLGLKGQGYSFANYISSKAFVWRTAELGENVFVFENNVIQHGCKIGNAVVLWSGNHIGHQTIIKDGAYLSSHVVVSGYCEIGERCFVGVNSTFADNVKIGNDCFIAMGTSITRSIQGDNKLIKGSPAAASDKLTAKRYFKMED